ncbi:damage-control phosphatase ARMT1 family protein [Sulfoacidibacillus ferrooxidans]|uniref:Damage-control phosphatase ARMT1-like metal-binding domain-containing protein n=1 Tax=Sulfoacidibacillus ferrooxidans TaxID=2005001 RepID=A0A9X2ACP6_9BACL|nr:ARMT1-like domain-containing protein [Sulfoacidibacillus ferrooxidans]MCI0182545.1 hypothetical protein [Sulfoacidibacillus ferrooxidans]
MKIAKECSQCFEQQLSRTLAKRAADNECKQLHKTILASIQAYSSSDSPALPLTTLYDSVQKELQDGDPYEEEKKSANQFAETYLLTLDHTKSMTISDWLLLATAANMIDVGLESDSEVMIQGFLKASAQGFMRNDLSMLEISPQKPMKIVYLLDNCGEAVFDREAIRLLVQQGHQVTAVVKSFPFLNDVTLKEAQSIGLFDTGATVIENGLSGVGMLPTVAPQHILNLFEDADLIIAKGIAHLESVTEFSLGIPIIFLYRTKCMPSARFADVPFGENVAYLLQPSLVGRT